MDALATLANATMGAYTGSGHPITPDFRDYQFSCFDDAVEPPTNVIGTSASGGDYTAGKVHTIRVHAYKTVFGRKRYSKRYATGSFLVPAGADLAVQWNWSPPSGGASGYVLLNGQEVLDGPGRYEFIMPFKYWLDVIAANYLDESSINWNNPGDLFVINPSDPNYNPVNAAPWTRELRLIKQDILNLVSNGFFTLTNDWLVSGPWCVAVGNRVVTNLGPGTGVNALCHYKDIEFWYPTSAHSGDLTITRESFIENSSGPNTADTWKLPATLSAPARVTGRFLVRCDTALGTWSHSITVNSGAATIVSETWQDCGLFLECEFVIDLPSGASEIWITAATTAGAPTFSRIWAGLKLDSIDLTPVDVMALHPSSACKKAVWGTGLTDAGQVSSFWGGVSNVSLRAEQIDGVWVAKTLPVFGEMVFLEPDIPTYGSYLSNYQVFGDQTTPGPRAAVPFFVVGEDGEQVEPSAFAQNWMQPSVANKPSLWPVFRDVDYLTWKPLANSSLKSPVPFFSNGVFASFENVSVSGDLHRGSVLAPDNAVALRVYATGDVPVRIYYSSTGALIDPDNFSTYDGYVDGGTLRIPEDFPIDTGHNLTLAFTSISGDPLTSLTWRWGLFVNFPLWDPGLLPVFFKRESIQGHGAMELFSYNFAPGTRADNLFSTEHLHERPLSGYCITRLIVRRTPRGTTFATIPTTGEAELEVQIGRMNGTTIDTPGTFVSMLTVTIPADDGQVEATVFWPVLDGTPIAYQCSETVDIQAFVNHQPSLISDFVRETTISPLYKGRFYGKPNFFGGFNTRVLRFPNLTNFDWPLPDTLDSYIALPPTATVYNDLEAVLNLM